MEEEKYNIEENIELSDDGKKGKKPKKEKKEKTKKMKTWKKVLIILGGLFLFGIGTGAFLLYGPWSYIRETLITTAMTTMSHQYLAKWFYSDETIEKVLNKNKVVEVDEDSNPNLIEITDPSDHHGSYVSKYDEEILTKDEGNDLYKVIEVSGSGYKGYLVAIYDPSKVHISLTRYLNVRGEALTTLAKNSNAVIAMNASGFYDPDWNGPGALPHGTVIQNGKIVSDYIDAPVGGGFIGFTYDNKLVLGRMSAQEALNMGMRDAIEFGPFLIVNGKRSFIKGNGGWGIAPRTAIGQRKDGIVLFLVIDGRRAHSIGADMVDLTDIMYNYGAYNAANLDGGSSSALVINNEIVNTPVAGGYQGLRDIPTAWIVTRD